jgi:hypothetical protein
MEEFCMIADAKHELAMDVFDLQDAPTQKAIEKIAAMLDGHAVGTATVGGRTRDIEPDVKIKLTFWLAVEIIKDLAFSDIKLAGFVFPATLCAECGAHVG